MEQIPPLVLLAALNDPRTALLIFDAELNLLHVTGQLQTLLGLRLDEPIGGLNMLQLLSKSSLAGDSAAIAKGHIAGFSADAPALSVLLNRQDNSPPIRMTLRNIGQAFRVASFEPAAGDETIRVQVTEFALRDSLTGLASRLYFEDAVTAALARRPEEEVFVLLIDLDRFKAVNDSLGHAVGDTLLRLAAERLKSAVRKVDLVARLGGDEFAVLLQRPLTPEEPIAIANRILDLVQRTYLIEGQLVNVGTSIGIARSPGDGNEYGRLLRSADLALYYSKTSGRSTFHFFEAHMEVRAQARRTSELELRRALALRQLEVFYQPQVNTARDRARLVGFEALLRWRHPERGLIPPGDFLSIAEETGMIVSIGDWVLRTACREAMKWPDDVVIAVNASPLQFDTGDFADSVRRALGTTGLPGERLEIEITEGTLLRNNETILRTLHELRSMNVRVAMDDFGTGYASLSQLAQFPFDKIKIDRSLVGFEGNNVKQRAIIRAIAALGQSLGVCTIAEGVENADQLDRLQRDGCSSVQGYFFGKPVPASQLTEIISRLHSTTETIHDENRRELQLT
jgi:diguanylate cyclase (GGDEF)-like protein